MSDELKIKKETLEQNFTKLLESVNNKTQLPDTIKIYEKLISTGKAELANLDLPSEKCTTCGAVLEQWEKTICGPCKIADERYQEELDE